MKAILIAIALCYTQRQAPKTHYTYCVCFYGGYHTCTVNVSCEASGGRCEIPCKREEQR